MLLCRMPIKQRNIKACMIRLSPIPAAQVTTRNRKAQVDSVQTVSKWCNENSVPTVDKTRFQAVFTSKLVVMSYAVLAIFVV